MADNLGDISEIKSILWLQDESHLAMVCYPINVAVQLF
jgi:hypothetical protein